MKVGEGRLPPELAEKKVVLQKMCEKLAKDDANIGSAEDSRIDFSKWDMKALVYSLLGVGSGYVLWNNRRWLGSNMRNLFEAKKFVPAQGVDGFARNNEYNFNANGAVNNGDKDLQAIRLLEAREARLKRFAEINVNANMDALPQ